TSSPRWSSVLARRDAAAWSRCPQREVPDRRAAARRRFHDASKQASTVLRRDSPQPLDEPLVRVITLVGEPDTCAKPQTARVLARNDGADDRSPFTLSDVRQQHLEQVAAKRHRPVVVERF